MEQATHLEADAALVAQFQRARAEARKEAFCALYARHAGGLRAWLARMSGSDQLADDLTQEAFLRALERLDGFRGNSSFKTWVYRIAINVFVDQVRRKAPVVDGGLAARERPGGEATPDELAERNEEARRVQQAVAALPVELRAPLLLVRLEGMKYREAAEALGISLAAVRMRVHRAHLALAEVLTE